MHAIILTTITPEAILRSQQVGVGAVIAVAVIILIIGAAVEHDHRMWERSKKMSLKRRKPTGLIWLANFFFAPEENARNKE